MYQSVPDNVQYDSNGWPTDLRGGEVKVMKFLGKLPPEILPEGDYSVLRDGVGKLRYGHDVKVVSQAAGAKLSVLLPERDGLLDASVVITQTDSANPLRNIRILPPGGICQRDPLTWPRRRKRVCQRGLFAVLNAITKALCLTPDYLRFMKDFSTIRLWECQELPVIRWCTGRIVRV